MQNGPNPEVKKYQFADLNKPLEQFNQTVTSQAELPELALISPAVADVQEQVLISDQDNASFVLDNAKADEAYSATLQITQAEGKSLQFLRIQIPQGLGLNFDPVTLALQGSPKLAGEHELLIHYRYPDDQGIRVARVSLLVIANPKSLWQTLPSDQTALYAKADQAAQYVVGKEFHLLAASKRGRSHAHVGSFREDDFSISYNDNDWCIAVVADGAGSCRYSRKASALICETAQSFIQQQLQNGQSLAIQQAAENFHRGRLDNVDLPRLNQLKALLRNELYLVLCYAAHAAVRKINDEVGIQESTGASYKDFSSTALITLCKRFSFGVLCAAYWVGDGAIALYRESSGVMLLGEVDSGEFSGQTRFLDAEQVTGEALMQRLRFELVDDMSALILLSDGVSDPMFETEARLKRDADWHQFWQQLNHAVKLDKEPGDQSKAEQLLNWLDFWSPGNHDDRTIAVIY